MSTLKADTIVASDGSSPVTLTKQRAAKCFCLFDQNAAAIDASFNTSSLTDTDTGKGILNWTNAMSGGETAYGCVTGTIAVAASNAYNVTLIANRHYVTQTSSAWPFRSVYGHDTTKAFFDPDGGMVAAHGDLA